MLHNEDTVSFVSDINLNNFKVTFPFAFEAVVMIHSLAI